MTFRIRDWRSGKVLVVGDVMLDQYWDGTTRRISPEAPVPVVKVVSESDRVGGAANVAANVAALSIDAELIGGVGPDAAAKRLHDLCRELKIETYFIAAEESQTTVKLRVLSQHQQLLRLDFEADEPGFSPLRCEEIFLDRLAAADVVILSDYNKGFLSGCSSLITHAKLAGKRVVVDPKSNDFTCYAGAYIVTPNFAEFEACVGHCGNEEEIVERGIRLCLEHEFHALLVTRGERGMTFISPHETSFTLPAKARDVFDVTGAGDTVCAVLGSALAAGVGVSEAVVYANAGAGIVVGKLGTATVSLNELDRALSFERTPSSGVVTLTELLMNLELARSRGERIVMTNGCFDVLHAGHVRYLEQARVPGSRLIVALNSDASVTRLKGDGRPVHRLEDRMRVIGALSAVDWVISFEADNPLQLVEAISPDILVKGGDYAVDEIIGGEHVLRTGGEVVVLPFSPGLSTSAIIEKLAADRT